MGQKHGCLSKRDVSTPFKDALAIPLISAPAPAPAPYSDPDPPLSDASTLTLHRGDTTMVCDVEKVCGYGGQGVLWLASTQPWNRVVLKRLDDDNLNSPECANAIKNAARMQTLNHIKHIPKLRGVIMTPEMYVSLQMTDGAILHEIQDMIWLCEEDDRLYCIDEGYGAPPYGEPTRLLTLKIGVLMVIDYVDGDGLFECYIWKAKLAKGILVDKKDWYEKWSAIEFAKQWATAISALHAAGVIHGDVDAANVIVSPDGSTLTMIDFDLCRRLDELSSDTDYTYGRGVPEDEHPRTIVTRIMREADLRLASESYRFALNVVCLFARGYLQKSSWGWPTSSDELREECLKWLDEHPTECPDDIRKVLRMMMDVSPLARPSVTVLKDVLYGGRIPVYWNILVQA